MAWGGDSNFFPIEKPNNYWFIQLQKFPHYVPNIITVQKAKSKYIVVKKNYTPCIQIIKKRENIKDNSK